MNFDINLDLPCEDDECYVCQAVSRLMLDGAEAVSLSELYEHDCHAHIELAESYSCVRAVRLDALDENNRPAKYVRSNDGLYTKMCDFAVLAAHYKELRVTAGILELKRGMGREDAFEQLRQGVRVIHDYCSRINVSSKVTAFYFVGRNVDLLRVAFEGEVAKFVVENRAMLNIVECGSIQAI